MKVVRDVKRLVPRKFPASGLTLCREAQRQSVYTITVCKLPYRNKHT